jgi:nicotinamide mononucleotide adenylyltransferase
MVIKHLGVLIGRFQAPILHFGYRSLISQAINSCDFIIVFICCTGNSPDKRNPFSFEFRKELLNVIINKPKQFLFLPLYDTIKDEDWSNNLDSKIKEFKFSKISLFDGKGSLTSYTGMFPVKNIDTVGNCSSTIIREIHLKEIE